MKNIILKSLTFIFAFLFLLSASCLDSQSMLPYFICVVSMIWLVLFGIVNGVIQLGGN